MIDDSSLFLLLHERHLAGKCGGDCSLPSLSSAFLAPVPARPGSPLAHDQEQGDDQEREYEGKQQDEGTSWG
uniref:Uncharacterized protein n=1 Tax=Thermogemmatispora argillosa TaxID=2045280 RepID=A0A455SWT7_9CHLR|nr:hypothetical protein KTA_03590 [Thermogemmatispora argillosa]